MSGLKTVLNKIEAAVARRSKNLPQIMPRLVAVSKKKPEYHIMQAYDGGQHHFGENFVTDLVNKSLDNDLYLKCPDIKWHYIGRLQSNKMNKLCTVRNLYMVETVDSEDIANALNKHWLKVRCNQDIIRVLVQVNTSGESSKNGIEPSETTKLVDYIMKNCSGLTFCGLMTMGRFSHDVSKGPNPDFLALVKCRVDVCRKLNLDIKDVELSMGTSCDYEHAIEMGATSVRVGRDVFGERE